MESVDIRIIEDPTKTKDIQGLVVVIDVLRAFTTACYMFANGAKKIISVAEIDEAYALKKQHPDYILAGERKGVKQKGFDYGNSPAELKALSFSNKTIIFTTTAGTLGIQKAIEAEEIITGSFVNAQAVVHYIQKKNPSLVTFLCTYDWHKENEDIQCARYMKSLLMGEPMDFQHIKSFMKTHPNADGFLLHPITQWGPQDFDMCMSLNTFDFIIKARKTNPIELHRGVIEVPTEAKKK